LVLVVANAAGAAELTPAGVVDSLACMQAAQRLNAPVPADVCEQVSDAIASCLRRDRPPASRDLPVLLTPSDAAAPPPPAAPAARRLLAAAIGAGGGWSPGDACQGFVRAVVTDHVQYSDDVPLRYVEDADTIIRYTDGALKRVSTTDGDTGQQAGSAAVRLGRDGTAVWRQLYRYSGLQHSFLAELVAFAAALADTDELSQYSALYIFTDSLGGLYKVRDFCARPHAYCHHPLRWVLAHIGDLLRALPVTTVVHMVKVRAHSGVPGNEAADVAAGEAATAEEGVEEAPLSHDDPDLMLTWAFSADGAVAGEGAATTCRRVQPMRGGGSRVLLDRLRLTRNEDAVRAAVTARDLMTAVRDPTLRRHKIYLSGGGAPPPGGEHLAHFGCGAGAVPYAYALDPVPSNGFWTRSHEPWFKHLLRARTDSCVTLQRLHLMFPREFTDPFCPYCKAAGIEVVDTITHWLSAGIPGEARGLCRAPHVGTLVRMRHDACVLLLAEFVSALLRSLPASASGRWTFAADATGHRLPAGQGNSSTLPSALLSALPEGPLRRMKPDVVLVQWDGDKPAVIMLLDCKVPVEHCISATDVCSLDKYDRQLGAALHQAFPGCAVSVRNVIVGARATLPHVTRSALRAVATCMSADVTKKAVEACLSAMIAVVARHTGLIVQTRQALHRKEPLPPLPGGGEPQPPAPADEYYSDDDDTSLFHLPDQLPAPSGVGAARTLRPLTPPSSLLPPPPPPPPACAGSGGGSESPAAGGGGESPGGDMSDGDGTAAGFCEGGDAEAVAGAAVGGHSHASTAGSGGGGGGGGGALIMRRARVAADDVSLRAVLRRVESIVAQRETDAELFGEARGGGERAPPMLSGRGGGGAHAAGHDGGDWLAVALASHRRAGASVVGASDAEAGGAAAAAPRAVLGAGRSAGPQGGGLHRRSLHDAWAADSSSDDDCEAVTGGDAPCEGALIAGATEVEVVGGGAAAAPPEVFAIGRLTGARRRGSVAGGGWSPPAKQRRLVQLAGCVVLQGGRPGGGRRKLRQQSPVASYGDRMAVERGGDGGPPRINRKRAAPAEEDAARGEGGLIDTDGRATATPPSKRRRRGAEGGAALPASPAALSR
jgi:ribonuclease HI